MGRADRRRRANPRPSQQCPGQAGAGCAWSSARLDKPAEIQPGRGQTHCLFCGDAQLDKTLAQQNGFQLTKTLKALRELDEAKYEAALDNLKGRKGAAFAADFGDRVGFAIYRAPHACATDHRALGRPSGAPCPGARAAERRRFEDLRAGGPAG